MGLILRMTATYANHVIEVQDLKKGVPLKKGFPLPNKLAMIIDILEEVL